MPKLVALDYDGVIADTNRVKSAWIAEHLGLDVPPWLCNRTECVPIIGLENYDRMSPIVYGRAASLRAVPMPGVAEAVWALRRTYRLIILTARTEEQIGWTRQWLAGQGLEDVFEEIRSSSGGVAKAEIVRQLGAVALIEDDVRHLRKAPEVRFTRIHLVPHSQAVSPEPGIVTVGNWSEVLSVLNDIDRGKGLVL